MERVCAIRVIAESELMQEFLTESEEEIGNSPLVDLKVRTSTRPAVQLRLLPQVKMGKINAKLFQVMLPRSTIITVKVRRNASSGDVYRMVAQAAGIRPENQDFFSLYEIVEHTFGELKLDSGSYRPLNPN